MQNSPLKSLGPEGVFGISAGKKYLHGQDRCTFVETDNRKRPIAISLHERMNYDAIPAKYLPNVCQRNGKR